MLVLGEADRGVVDQGFDADDVGGGRGEDVAEAGLVFAVVAGAVDAGAAGRL